jgi:sec-independent protein translocase protein TatA
MVCAFIAGLGVWEILVILVVALIVFGPRLPEVAKSIGKGYLEFRRGLRSFESELEFHDTDVDGSGPRRAPSPGPSEPENPEEAETGGPEGEGGAGTKPEDHETPEGEEKP